MATAAQITANQDNSSRSTGPRTAAGKSRVSQNALRHGLTAGYLVIREDKREEFAALQTALLAELAPEGAVETVTLPGLLHAAWNLQRFRCLEADDNPDLEDPAAAAFLDRLGRYQARAQRSWYRALGNSGSFRPIAPCAPSSSQTEKPRSPPSPISMN